MMLHAIRILTVFLVCLCTTPVLGDTTPVLGDTSESNADEPIQERTSNTGTMDRSEPQDKNNEWDEAEIWFVLFLSIMPLCYFLQAGFCVRMAKDTKLPKYYSRAKNLTIWRSLWKDDKSKFRIWSFVIMAFFFPFMFGIVPDIVSELGDTRSDTDGITARNIYKICIAILTVLITVEFTHLANAPSSQIWQRMLVVSLAFDIITLLILTYYFMGSVDPHLNSGPTTLGLMTVVNLFAFISSFFIVVCVRELTIHDTDEMKVALEKFTINRNNKPERIRREESKNEDAS